MRERHQMMALGESNTATGFCAKLKNMPHPLLCCCLHLLEVKNNMQGKLTTSDCIRLETDVKGRSGPIKGREVEPGSVRVGTASDHGEYLPEKLTFQKFVGHVFITQVVYRREFQLQEVRVSCEKKLLASVAAGMVEEFVRVPL